MEFTWHMSQEKLNWRLKSTEKCVIMYGYNRKEIENIPSAFDPIYIPE